QSSNVARQQRGRFLSRELAQMAADLIDDGVEPLVGHILPLVATARQDDRFTARAQLREERAHESTLAHARFAVDEQHDRLAGAGGVAGLMETDELGIATEQERRAVARRLREGARMRRWLRGSEPELIAQSVLPRSGDRIARQELCTQSSQIIRRIS